MTVSVERVSLLDIGFIRQTKYADNPDSIAKLGSCIALSISSWKGRIDGDVVCMWGLIPPSLMSEQAYLWLLTTDAVHEHTFTFVRQSQIFMTEMLKEFRVIVGHCDLREPRAKKWLQWLGAKFDVSDGPLVPFRITRHG